MQYNFNFMKMEMLLHNFNNICNVRFSLIDNNNEILCHSKELTEFCDKIRNHPNGLARCKECDAKAIRHVNKYKPAYYSYKCHAGILETLIPIKNSDVIVGNIFLGQYLNPYNIDQQWDVTRRAIGSWYEGADSLKKAFYDIVKIETSTIISSSKILTACSNYINSECLTLGEEYSNLKAVTEYIDLNYQNKLTLDDIANALAVSKTTLCNIASKSDTTINTLIKERRIKVAKELLKTTSYPITEISTMVGIPDYNYFTKIFKSSCNCTPSEFKKTHE